MQEEEEQAARPSSFAQAVRQAGFKRPVPVSWSTSEDLSPSPEARNTSANFNDLFPTPRDSEHSTPRNSEVLRGQEISGASWDGPEKPLNDTRNVRPTGNEVKKPSSWGSSARQWTNTLPLWDQEQDGGSQKPWGDPVVKRGEFDKITSRTLPASKIRPEEMLDSDTPSIDTYIADVDQHHHDELLSMLGIEGDQHTARHTPNTDQWNVGGSSQGWTSL